MFIIREPSIDTLLFRLGVSLFLVEDCEIGVSLFLVEDCEIGVSLFLVEDCEIGVSLFLVESCGVLFTHFFCLNLFLICLFDYFCDSGYSSGLPC